MIRTRINGVTKIVTEDFTFYKVRGFFLTDHDVINMNNSGLAGSKAGKELADFYNTKLGTPYETKKQKRQLKNC